MLIKRSHIASFVHRIGVTRLIAKATRSSGLIVLCYHRIGDGRDTDYDSGTFSATVDDFHDQVSYLKATYGIATLDETLSGPDSWAKGTRVLLTFDDAYLDNYKSAYPVLRSLGVQATFLLPTQFVGSNLVPWWDAIAHMIANSSERYLRLPLLSDAPFDKSAGAATVIRQILQLYKRGAKPTPQKMAVLLNELSESAGMPVPIEAPHRRFFSWEEAREMLRSGMAMGSHSHTHPLMGGLSREAQMEEALLSRWHITENLGVAPRVFALPCGHSGIETTGVLSQAGYEMSLTTLRGLNCAATWNPLCVRRVYVSPEEQKGSSRLRMALMSSLSKYPDLVEAL